MIRNKKKTLWGGLAASAAALALAVGAPVAANAATGVTVISDTGSGAGYTSDVNVSDTVLGASYTLGLCSTATFGGRPACTYLEEFTGTGNDVLLEDVALAAYFVNEHSGGTQPADYLCSAVAGADGSCQVVAVLHSPPYTFVGDAVSFS